MSLNLNNNNNKPKTEREIELEKEQLEARIQELYEQKIMLGCSDRICNRDGCNRLGIYLVAACKVSYGNYQNPLYDSGALRYRRDYYGHDYNFAVDSDNIHPFYFLCKQHMEEQMLSNNKHNSNLIREMLMAGRD